MRTNNILRNIIFPIKMSFPYIHNLGITRLKEIGKILQIPRYTTYKDPEQLREYIQTFLTKKNQVTQVHLRKIQKTKEDIDRLTRHIAVIAAKYKNAKDDPVRSRPRSEVKELASNEMANLLQQLQNCQAQLGVPCIPSDLKEELSKHLQLSNDTNVNDLIRTLIDSDNQSRQNIKVSEQKLLEEQTRAVANLRESQGRIERLNAANAALDQKISKLVDDQKADKSLVPEIARLTDQLKVQTIELYGKIAELETSKTIIDELQTRIGLDAYRETKFSTELSTLHKAYEQLQQTNGQQAEIILLTKEEKEDCDMFLVHKTRELVTCTDRKTLCEEKLSPIEDGLRLCKISENLLRVDLRQYKEIIDMKYAYDLYELQKQLFESKEAIKSAGADIEAKYQSELQKNLEMNTVIDENGEKIRQANEKLSMLQQNLETCELNAKKYEGIHEKLEKEAQSCRKELAVTQSNLKNKSGRALENLRTKVKELAAAEQKCNLNIEQLERSFAVQKKGDTEKFEQIIGQCNTDLAKFKRLHSQFVGNLQDEERKNKKCNTELEATKGNMGRFHNQLSACQKELAETKTKLSSAEANLVTANQTIQQLKNLMLQNRTV